MTVSVSFYLIAILALCVKSHSLQERNVLIVDHNVYLKTVELPGPTRCQSKRIKNDSHAVRFRCTDDKIDKEKYSKRSV